MTWSRKDFWEHVQRCCFLNVQRIFSYLGVPPSICCAQATRIDLLQARSSLQGAEEDCRSALSAADQARRHLADRESGWRHEADDLRVSLKKALATAEKQNQEEARTSEQGEAPDQSLQASDARISSPERPEVRSTDDHAVENEGRQFSVSGASDATSRDSPEELMQKLKHEANQRRHNRAGSCNEVKFLIDQKRMPILFGLMTFIQHVSVYIRHAGDDGGLLNQYLVA